MDGELSFVPAPRLVAVFFGGAFFEELCLAEARTAGDFLPDDFFAEAFFVAIFFVGDFLVTDVTPFFAFADFLLLVADFELTLALLFALDLPSFAEGAALPRVPLDEVDCAFVPFDFTAPFFLAPLVGEAFEDLPLAGEVEFLDFFTVFFLGLKTSSSQLGGIGKY